MNTITAPEKIATSDSVIDASQKTTPSQKIVISLFKNEKDNTPQQRTLTWEQCRRLLFSASSPRALKGGFAFSPVSYRPMAKRGVNGVDMVYCAVFDVEHHGSFDQVRPLLDGYEYVCHSSYSHTLGHPRYRIVLPLTRPVPALEWPVVWARLNLWAGEINDPNTKDASRIYYLPSHPPGVQGHFLVHGEGRFLDVDELPHPPPQQGQQAKSHPRPHVHIDGLEELPQEPQSPAIGLGRVVARCKFMQTVSDPANQPQISRALWRAMISNASRFEDSDVWIHSASDRHPGYGAAATQKEIESFHAFRGGPITCQRIREDGFKGCPEGGCLTVAGNVTGAPAGLWMGALEKPEGPYAGIPLPEHVIAFLVDQFPEGLTYVNEGFRAYSQGYWRMLEERGEVRHRIARHLGKSATEAKQINDLLSLTKDFMARSEADTMPNLRYICLENGTLDLVTCELVSHDPAFALRCKIPASWQANAACRRWLQFLREIFEQDADAAEKIQFLQEWFGYCLTADSGQHKFVWMVGGGGNGKSVLVGILSQLLGPSNVSHAHLERLERPAVRAELEGKLVNISSEMSAESTMADGYLKAIVSGDEIDAERKYKPPYSFKPFVRLIGATNHLPRLLDLSDGFFRRAVVLKFNRRFTEAQQDKALPEKLAGELNGILAWSVAGLQRLRERGSFVIPSSSVAALDVYREESDPVKMFADECLEASATSALSAKDIYAAYKDWCLAYGFRAGNNATFGKRMMDLGYVGQRRAEGRVWNVKEKPDNGFLNQFGTIDSVPIAQESKPATTAGAVTAVTGNDGKK